ncbi:MAG: CocE/NonD family hydrolase [Acidobacteriota bacterium]|nr:CocE/NonD family hydrolase [Acidobacteriota bacterium]
MRDGKRLFTAVYTPKNASILNTAPYPILLTRTPYGVGPYGVNNYPAVLGPSRKFDQEGFIFVFQDVRGRYMSEGQWVEMRPPNAKIDESTDTYDTIEWLLKNVRNNNGKVGLLGISYPGFYATAGLINAHPALVAASPQAPIADLFMGDDAYHNGAFFLEANFSFYRGFAPQMKPTPTDTGSRFHYGTQNGYDFFLRMGPLVRSQKYFHGRNPYWNDLLTHTTYDEFWKERDILPHLHGIKPAILVVGGWFDAEDLAGTLGTYRAIRLESPATKITLAMGPWSHGAWEEGSGRKLGNIDFGSNTSEFFQDNIALPFFLHYLKGKDEPSLPNAYVFATGKDEWRKEDSWPPANSRPLRLYLEPRKQLSVAAPSDAAGFDEYVSDPERPVPFFEGSAMNVPPQYMDADQSFAERRPDVLTYSTEPLAEDLTVAGPITPTLYISTTATDSDFVVKVIDAYPTESGGRLGGYEQLVRGEPFRAKFRESFETPRPLPPRKVQKIEYAMPDVYHCFRKGHRLMIQIQSSWFPLVDRNPQTFTNIPKAKKEDFKKATERIYRSGSSASYVDFRVEH